MDEIISLTDDTDDDMGVQEDDDIELLFDLCKDDFPLSSKEQTVNVGRFLKELEKTGLRRNDIRLSNLINLLNEIAITEGGDWSSIDNLHLNKDAFKRYFNDIKLAGHQTFNISFMQGCETRLSNYVEGFQESICYTKV